jgi:hypothetical protein
MHREPCTICPFEKWAARPILEPLLVCFWRKFTEYTLLPGRRCESNEIIHGHRGNTGGERNCASKTVSTIFCQTPPPEILDHPPTLKVDPRPCINEIVSKIILNPECFLKKNCSGIQKKIRIPDKKSIFYLNNFFFKKFQNLKFIMQRVPCESNLVMVTKIFIIVFYEFIL